jgi:hypothetical protein
MATELAMAMRRLKAQETLVRHVADLNRKMDLVMAKLGIVEEVPGDSVAVEATDEAPAAVVEPKADKVPAVVVEPKSKKK